MPEVWAKSVQLLKEAAPWTTHVAYFRNARTLFSPAAMHTLQTATQVVGVRLQVLEVRESDEHDCLLAEMAKEPRAE